LISVVTSPHVGGYDLAKICLCFQAIVFTDQYPYQLIPCVSRPIMDRSKLIVSYLSSYFVHRWSTLSWKPVAHLEVKLKQNTETA